MHMSVYFCVFFTLYMSLLSPKKLLRINVAHCTYSRNSTIDNLQDYLFMKEGAVQCEGLVLSALPTDIDTVLTILQTMKDETGENYHFSETDFSVRDQDIPH